MTNMEHSPTDGLGIDDLSDEELLVGIEHALVIANNRSDDLGRTAAKMALDFANTRHDVSLESIEDPFLRKAFARYFGCAELIYDKLHIIVPNADEFAAAGVDFANLSTDYNELVCDNRQPELVVYPIMPIQDSSRPSWDSLFRGMSGDIDTRMGGRGVMGIKEHPRLCGKEEKIRDAEESSLKSHPGVHLVKQKNGVFWGVSVISGSIEPETSKSLMPLYQKDRVTTISESLALQALLIKQGLPSVVSDEWQLPDNIDIRLCSRYDFRSKYIVIDGERGFNGNHSARSSIRG